MVSEAAAPMFERLAPVPPQHPRSTYPMLPVVGVRSGTGVPLAVRSRFLEPDALFTTSGSAAISCAIQAAGAGADDEVLVPAYHCPTMIWPVQAAGAAPVLVPVTPELTVRLTELRSRRGPRTRVVLLPHLFGLMQPEAFEIRRWCERSGITLIEDCAHAFYGTEGTDLPGSAGHYAIASLRKFFPGTEGGALVSNIGRLESALPSPSIRHELRCLLGTLQLAAEYGGMPWQADARPLQGDVREGALDAAGAAVEARPARASVDELESARARRRSCRFVRWLVHHEPHAVSAGIRRARWQRWRAAIDGVPGVEPLVDELAANVVPYVFAARLHDPARAFPALKYAGVQVWRWDRLAISDCATSRRLALELIQLPCQQSLRDEAFEHLVQAFVAVLRSI